jgi:hypothetical protein
MMLIVSSCSSNGWTESAKEDFLNGCLRTAKIQGVMNSEDYCNCMQVKVEKKFPDFRDFEALPAAELQSIAKTCADSALAKTAYWPENIQKTFLDGCEEVAKDKGIKNTDEYCQCVMEGVMYYYPKAEDLAQLNKDSLDKISYMCQTYYDKDSAR